MWAPFAGHTAERSRGTPCGCPSQGTTPGTVQTVVRYRKFHTSLATEGRFLGRKKKVGAPLVGALPPLWAPFVGYFGVRTKMRLPCPSWTKKVFLVVLRGPSWTKKVFFLALSWIDEITTVQSSVQTNLNEPCYNACHLLWTLVIAHTTLLRALVSSRRPSHPENPPKILQILLQTTRKVPL